MNEELYLRQLNVVYTDASAEKCYIQIPILKNEYKYFEIVRCNDKGYIINSDEKLRIVKKENISESRIYFKRDKFSDKYYKIIPVLKDDTRVQADDGETGNMICIRVSPIVITYSVTIPRGIARLFGNGNVTLDIRCTENIESGNIGYERNGVFFPLPKIDKTASFKLPFGDDNIRLTNANAELNYTYKKE